MDDTTTTTRTRTTTMYRREVWFERGTFDAGALRQLLDDTVVRHPAEDDWACRWGNTLGENVPPTAEVSIAAGVGVPGAAIVTLEWTNGDVAAYAAEVQRRGAELAAADEMRRAAEAREAAE